MPYKFHRGEYLKCKVTGFRGFVSSRSDHITACNQYFLHPGLDKDGKIQEGHWFDEVSLERDLDKHGQRVSLDRTVDQAPG